MSAIGSPAEINRPRPLRIGVVGLGRIGSAILKNLVEDGHEVWVFDRSWERSAAAAAASTRAARTLAELVVCDYVMTAVSDDDALIAVALKPGGLLDILKPGATHVALSTVSPDLSARIETAHREKSQHFVAAPILGNPKLVSARDVFILVAGAADAVAGARPILEQLAKKIFVVGENASAANLLKLAGNALTAATLQSFAEVMALLNKAGISPKFAYDVFTQSLFDGQVHKSYGRKIVEGNYSPPGMTVPLALKDLRLVLAQSESLAAPMPVTSLIHDRYVAALGQGWSELDWSVLGRLAECEAGLAVLD